ncbi:hypothetical protein HDZ31DRAFT_35959 [Schizophyllum fasciatum]
MLPAHLTKHQSVLRCHFLEAAFDLDQLSDGVVNGTALWLSGQILAYYIADNYRPKDDGNNKLCELGSGIGLTALAAATLGWQVLATDTKDVVQNVLRTNIMRNNAHCRRPVQVSELDWTVPSEDWDWQDANAIATPSERTSPSPSSDTTILAPPFDLICTGDTVYSPELVTPLLRTLHALCVASKTRKATVLLCLERRDPAVADKLLGDAKNLWQFTIEKVSQRKLVKAMKKGGLNWAQDDWDGIQLYKLRLR